MTTLDIVLIALILLIGGIGVVWGLLAVLATVGVIALPMALLAGTWDRIKKLTD